MLKPRKQPLRRCTGCMAEKDKREMIRIVRAPDGTFALDITGRKNGRGAYICPNAQCLALAHKRKGLERSFKTNVPDEIFEQLRMELINAGSLGATRTND